MKHMEAVRSIFLIDPIDLHILWPGIHMLRIGLFHKRPQVLLPSAARKKNHPGGLKDEHRVQTTVHLMRILCMKTHAFFHLIQHL